VSGAQCEAGVDSGASSGGDGLGWEESERFRGENVRRIGENTQRVQRVQGEEQSLWGGLDEKRLGEGLGTFSPLLLLCLNPPTSCILLPTPPEPFEYFPGSRGRNLGRMGYRCKNAWRTGVCGREGGVDKSQPQGA